MRPLNVREAVRSLKRDGLYVIHDALSSAEVAELRADGHRLHAERPPYVREAIGGSAGFRLNLIPARLDRHHAWATLPSYGRVLGEPGIQAIAKGYLGRGWGVSNFIYDYSVPAGTELFTLHYDDFDGCVCLKVYAYLTDCDRGNGGFRYVPGTHRLAHWLIRRNRRTLNVPSTAGSSDYTEYDLATFLAALGASPLPPGLRADYDRVRAALKTADDHVIRGRAGTIALFDTSGIHGAGTHTEGDRYICRYHLVDRRYVLRHIPAQARPLDRWVSYTLSSIRRRVASLLPR